MVGRERTGRLAIHRSIVWMSSATRTGTSRCVARRSRAHSMGVDVPGRRCIIATAWARLESETIARYAFTEREDPIIRQPHRGRTAVVAAHAAASPCSAASNAHRRQRAAVAG